LSGNPCGNGACISTGTTTFRCECPIGYDDVGCLGIIFIFIFVVIFLLFYPNSKFDKNRYWRMWFEDR